MVHNASQWRKHDLFLIKVTQNNVLTPLHIEQYIAVSWYIRGNIYIDTSTHCIVATLLPSSDQAMHRMCPNHQYIQYDHRVPSLPYANIIITITMTTTYLTYKRLWISSKRFRIAGTASDNFRTTYKQIVNCAPNGQLTFSPVSLDAATNCSFLISWGPISTLKGTP